MLNNLLDAAIEISPIVEAIESKSYLAASSNHA